MTWIPVNLFRPCPKGFTCMRKGRNPNYAYTSFDNFGWSLLSAIRMTTQDFWENLVLLVSAGMMVDTNCVCPCCVCFGLKWSPTCLQTLRANGKSHMAAFVLVFFPAVFLLVSLVVSKFAIAVGEQLEARLAQASQKHEEFGQIMKVLKEKVRLHCAAMHAHAYIPA